MESQPFVFKQFVVHQHGCAMKVGTDGVLLGAWAKLPAHGQVLDIGTGTGLIAMMIAQQCGARIDAIEIDEDAYRQAFVNCANSKWKERIDVIRTSLEEYASGCGKKYDAIISNPPYFSNSLQPASESRTKARHASALTFEGLLHGVTALLKPKGTFATILPLPESEELMRIAERRHLYPARKTRVITIPTKPAKRILMEFGFARRTSREDTLIIENEDHTYTSSYKELTRDFYLRF